VGGGGRADFQLLLELSYNSDGFSNFLSRAAGRPNVAKRDFLQSLAVKTDAKKIIRTFVSCLLMPGFTVAIHQPKHQIIFQTHLTGWGGGRGAEIETEGLFERGSLFSLAKKVVLLLHRELECKVESSSRRS